MPHQPRSTDRQALQFELPLFTRDEAPPPAQPLASLPARPPAATSPAGTVPPLRSSDLLPAGTELSGLSAEAGQAPHPHQAGAPDPRYAMPPVMSPVMTTPTPATATPGTTTIHGEKTRRIALEQQPLDYLLRRSRRRSIGFVIDENGLTVSAPKWVTIAQIEAAVREKQHWIFAKMAEMRERRALVPEVRWASGGTLPYLGAPVTLRVVHGASARGETIRLDRDTRELHVALPPSASAQQLKDRVQGWLQAEARALFTERLEIYAERLGVRHRVLRLSSATTRWGSCSADGKILLNWRLVHFPLSSIDYVVAHELAHLREMNHGPRFWQTVADLLPGFESARAHLKNPPPELLPKF